MTTTEQPPDRVDTPDDDHPVLELTYKVSTTHRLRLNLGTWADDFADWFETYNDDETPLTAAQINNLLNNTRHLPEMLKDHLIQESAGDQNVLDADMDDYDLRVAWVRPRGTGSLGADS